MKNAVFKGYDGIASTNFAVGDGLCIRMIDYANFLKMLLNNGMHNGV